jgi:hypothetical protein
MAVFDEARQRLPVLQAVVDGLGRGRAVGQLPSLVDQPSVQLSRDPAGLALSNSSSFIGRGASHLFLDPEEHLEVPQRLLAELAAVVGPQFVEFPPGVRNTPSLGDAALEGGLVAGEAVGDERALPGLLAVLAQEAAHVLAAAGLGEVEHHRLDRVEEGGSVAPDVALWVFLLPGLSMPTGVSSACSTAWRSNSFVKAYTSGCSCASHSPTHCASVERAIRWLARSKMRS